MGSDIFMLGALWKALVTISDPVILLVILAATLVAVIFGILPGLNASMLAVLILPFVFTMDKLIALPLMAAVQAVAQTGGSLTSILIGVPGTPGNAATVLDGFPMSKKGEGARAMGVTIMASTSGGVISIILAFLMIPLIVPLVMKFRSPELFCLIVAGLFFLATLTRGSTIKGLISAGLGILIACIGYHTKSGLERFTFGNWYLYNGVPAIVLLMAMFALPSLAELYIQGKPVAAGKAMGIGSYRQTLKGMADVFRHRFIWLASLVIGYIIGVIPGLGGTVSSWIAYGYAKGVSKHSEEFGKGNIEGVIAPETSNNSEQGGAMVTTLAFGIPGDGGMVLFLAAMVMVGLRPGPIMLLQETNICFVILLSIAAANLIAGLLCFSMVPYLDRITRITPFNLFCFTLPLIYVGVYSSDLQILDIALLLIFGAIGILLKRCGFNLAALILGFILGRLFEHYLWLSLDGFGPLFWTSPICLALLISVILTLTKDLWMPFISRLKGGAKQSL
jgi:TctA family transporter